MIPVRFVPGRSCGTCTLCCKVFDVPELSKPKDQWCSHATKARGCGTYASRPAVCQEFMCLWLQGVMPDALRPDRIHGVLTTTDDGANLQIQEDPGFPGVASQALDETLQPFIERGHYVVVVTGAKRRLLALPEVAAKLLSAAQARVDGELQVMRAGPDGTFTTMRKEPTDAANR